MVNEIYTSIGDYTSWLEGLKPIDGVGFPDKLNTMANPRYPYVKSWFLPRDAKRSKRRHLLAKALDADWCLIECLRDTEDAIVPEGKLFRSTVLAREIISHLRDVHEAPAGVLKLVHITMVKMQRDVLAYAEEQAREERARLVTHYEGIVTRT